MQSEQINELATALAKAQGEMQNAIKDGINTHRHNSYATLNSIWDACRNPLSKNGLSISQIISQSGESFFLTTMLIHSSGQWVKSIAPLPAGKVAPQDFGSAITYMRKYALAAIVGVTAEEDDDGDAAQEAANKIIKKEKSDTTLSDGQAKEIENVIGDDLELLNRVLEAHNVSKIKEIKAKDFQFILTNLKTLKQMK